MGNIFVVTKVSKLLTITRVSRGHWKTRNNGRTEYRNNGITLITGNENTLNLVEEL